MNKSQLFRILGTLLFVSCALIFNQKALMAESPDDLVVIANKNFKASTLSAADVKRMFKKELTTFRGTKVKPIHAKKGSALRKQFVSRAMGMNESSEQKYWQDMMVKKGVNPPTELSNTVRGVFSAPGAISYCFRKDFNPATAKIVLEL